MITDQVIKDRKHNIREKLAKIKRMLKQDYKVLPKSNTDTMYKLYAELSEIDSLLERCIN